MPIMHVNMRTLDKALRKQALLNMHTFKRVARRTLEVDGMRAIAWSIRTARPTPVDTGDYARSWQVEDTKEGAQLFSTASPPVKAGVIEFGRRRAYIPIAPLMEWVKRKLRPKSEAEAKGIAFAISKKASQRARPGLHILGRSKPKILAALAKNFKREMARRK